MSILIYYRANNIFQIFPLFFSRVTQNEWTLSTMMITFSRRSWETNCKLLRVLSRTLCRYNICDSHTKAYAILFLQFNRSLRLNRLNGRAWVYTASRFRRKIIFRYDHKINKCLQLYDAIFFQTFFKFFCATIFMQWYVFLYMTIFLLLHNWKQFFTIRNFYKQKKYT